MQIRPQQPQKHPTARTQLRKLDSCNTQMENWGKWERSWKFQHCESLKDPNGELSFLSTRIWDGRDGCDGKLQKKAGHLGSERSIEIDEEEVTVLQSNSLLGVCLCRKGFHFEEENGDVGCESLQEERDDDVVSLIDFVNDSSDLVHAIFKLVWSSRALERQMIEGTDALDCEKAICVEAEAVQRAATIAEAEGVSKIEATHLERVSKLARLGSIYNKNPLNQTHLISVLEKLIRWKPSHHQNRQQHSETVYIAPVGELECLMVFWCNVANSSRHIRSCDMRVVFRHCFCKPEICNSSFHIIIKQDICWLEISMNDVREANPSSLSRKAKSSFLLIRELKIAGPESLPPPLTTAKSSLKSREKMNPDMLPARAPAKNPSSHPPSFFFLFLCFLFFGAGDGPGALEAPLPEGARAAPEEFISSKVEEPKIAKGTNGSWDFPREEIVSNGKFFQVGKKLEETQVPGKLVGREVEDSKANELGQLGWNFPGELVVSEVENLKFPAVNDLRRDLVNKAVVCKSDLFELGEPPNCRRQKPVKPLGLKDQPGDFEDVSVVV
ncbi:Leucine-rich repeat protein kinase family protein [Prunus dulcis]|uniref:Leucine-rich repeat protein kinase family protein n=1 Tax=Prunus dulcis TaxID=3755 RepID=A0A4Y1RJ38_PRUDU|nr:Leucine-rich repeat protein kinase family protein [Prunus dulcis]